jgi:hypothetical protein
VVNQEKGPRIWPVAVGFRPFTCRLFVWRGFCRILTDNRESLLLENAHLGIGTIGTIGTTAYRVHRLEMATFLRTFSHDGILDPACGGWGCSPTSFHSIYHLHSSYVATFTLSQARLYIARYSYLFDLKGISSLSPSLWLGPYSIL